MDLIAQNCAAAPPGRVDEIIEGKGRICRRVLEDLTDWFGIPEALDAYCRDVEALAMFGYIVENDVPGFIALKRHNDLVAEAYVLGVVRRWHRHGIGRKLIEHVKARMAARGMRFLTVKTVADSQPSSAYGCTRRFYEAMGFVPVEEFPDLWGPDNPCLFMIAPVGGPAAA